jgi:hypothetical protein
LQDERVIVAAVASPTPPIPAARGTFRPLARLQQRHLCRRRKNDLGKHRTQQYGVANDVGVAWPPNRSPITLAVLSTKYGPNGPTDNPLVARTAALVAAALT